MKAIYKDVTTLDGFESTSFTITTNKGFINGIYVKSENRIMVHLVFGQQCLKGLMSILVKKFKTNKVTFTPLITDGIKNKVRGTMKTISENAYGNPYGEKFEVLETEWVI
jgi:hypothetical protein